MFFKLPVIVTSVLVTLSAATDICPTINPPTSPQCCAEVAPFNNPWVLDLADTIGIPLGCLDGVPIGVSCTPIIFPKQLENCAGVSVLCDPPEPQWISDQLNLSGPESPSSCKLRINYSRSEGTLKVQCSALNIRSPAKAFGSVEVITRIDM
ncbi:hypothetical protein GGX14DRAFT_407179 [Mycena pura]|uniref:Hydrophobin n=1 Tax=Mycena pura TaxID=153505 RepID=A0AAD6UNT2_9AGAR|nr:hypothetical protein GGX14DRAFT_407179 [Mycena pura]